MLHGGGPVCTSTWVSRKEPLWYLWSSKSPGMNRPKTWSRSHVANFTDPFLLNNYSKYFECFTVYNQQFYTRTEKYIFWLAWGWNTSNWNIYRGLQSPRYLKVLRLLMNPTSLPLHKLLTKSYWREFTWLWTSRHISEGKRKQAKIKKRKLYLWGTQSLLYISSFQSLES